MRKCRIQVLDDEGRVIHVVELNEDQAAIVNASCGWIDNGYLAVAPRRTPFSFIGSTVQGDEKK